MLNDEITDLVPRVCPSPFSLPELYVTVYAKRGRREENHRKREWVLLSECLAMKLLTYSVPETNVIIDVRRAR